MDQSVVAGVGNVYRPGAVRHRDPSAPARHRLRSGRARGTLGDRAGDVAPGVKDGRIVTVSRSELGITGSRRIPRREATYAYKRDRCLRCGDEIRRIEIANRTCYYCPTDQPR